MYHTMCHRDVLFTKNVIQDMWLMVREIDWKGAEVGMKSKLHHDEATCSRLLSEMRNEKTLAPWHTLAPHTRSSSHEADSF